jgi:phosphocarrier protein FPr/phosphocarrier protein
MNEPILLNAPLPGWLCDLSEVPDEVFAGRMMGDGIAIDPFGGEMVAPCDGTVVVVAPTAHAVTLRIANGAEILLHVGIDTVSLGGKACAAHVKAGDAVRQGARLLSFDLDVLALEAKSLLTPIVVTDSESFVFTTRTGHAVAAGAPIGSVVRRNGSATSEKAEDGPVHRAEVGIALPNGLHARPAARIAAAAKAWQADLRLRAANGEASARSPVSVMALDVRAGDRLEIVGSGEDAAEAVAALARLIENELARHEASPATPVPAPGVAPKASAGTIVGVCAVAGVALGPAARLNRIEQEVERDGRGRAEEEEALETALASVRASIEAAVGSGTQASASIAAAHLELLGDEALRRAAGDHLAAGRSAGFAWREASRTLARKLAKTGNALLVERVDDLLDLELQVLAALGGSAEAIDIPAGAIVVADEILPSQLLQLAGRAAGLCTSGGGPTSHLAVLAASAELPLLVAAGRALDSIADGTLLLLDAGTSRLVVDPAPAVVDAARTRIAAARVRHGEQRERAGVACRTADGTRIELFANLASAEGAAEAVAAGAEGCGLLRTEFLFLDRQIAPSEDEQLEAYQAVADALDGRPLIVRTLDVGGDKPLAYLPLPPEDNPALGLRGIRVGLARPDLLDEQIRAILRVTPSGRCRIMVPMVSDVAELRAVRLRVNAIAAQLDLPERAELGVMIETPAAALLGDRLALEADFLSVGTNDLAQYALAIDRTNPALAAQADAFHPAVLRLIAIAAEAAARTGRPIGVCGGLASDPLAAPLLVGLGVTELSAVPAALGAVKARLLEITIEQCRALAERALQEDSAAAVRALLAASHSDAGH